jgi:metal-responsive CopG/Arc/MetJ family transcriptional regulator
VSQKLKKVTITVPHALCEAVEDMARREGQSWHSMLLRLVRRGIIETKVLHERLGKEGQPIHSDICSIAERDKEKR